MYIHIMIILILKNNMQYAIGDGDELWNKKYGKLQIVMVYGYVAY